VAKPEIITSPEKDYSNGIDAWSSESTIEPGFVRDLLNADIVGRRAKKRAGYQGYAGNVPVRVIEMEYVDSGNQIKFTLDSSTSFENTTPSPIVVYGRSSTFTTGQGPFTTDGDTVEYFSSYTVPLRKELSAGSGTLSVEADEHGIGTAEMFVGVVESTNSSDFSYTAIGMDSIEIDESSFQIDMDYTTATDREVFVYYKDRAEEGGSVFVEEETHDGSPASQSFTYSAATHGLSSLNIVPRVYLDTGTTRELIEPESVTITAAGEVEITIENSTGASQDYVIILSAADPTYTVSGTVAGSSTGTVVIPDLESPWVFYSIYLEDGSGGLELVEPESIVYDDTTAEATITFVNGIATSRTFTVYYEYGELQSNVVTAVTATNITVDGVDERPQITIWGLEWSELYPDGTRELRESWVNHIDSYRRSGESRVVCGLGGNLFTARTYDEAGEDYGYGYLYPNLSNRTAEERVIGPTFWTTGETPGRTRGYITGTNITSDNLATVTSVSYNTLTGRTDFVVTIPSMACFNAAGESEFFINVIDPATDYITVSGMPYSHLNGTHQLVGVDDDGDTITFTCEIETNSADYDDDGCSGLAGIFTDHLEWTDTSQFLPGDLLLTSTLTDTELEVVFTSDVTTTVVGPVEELLTVPSGFLVTGKRTSSVIPLREGIPTKTPSTEYMVRGDMLSYSGEDEYTDSDTFERLLRVKYVVPDADFDVDLSGDGETATATLTSGSTASLSIGQKLLLTASTDYDGEITISDILSDTEFTFESEDVDTGSGVIVGNTIEVDESFTWSDLPTDANYLRVEERWIPVEAVDDSYDLTPNTYVRHLDASSYAFQSFLRSVMIADNMYLTDGENPVVKYDGSNISRAGIPAYQPGCFITVDTAASAKIVTSLRSVAYSTIAAAAGKVQVDVADQQSIPVGTSVLLTGSSTVYEVIAHTDNGSDYYIVLNRALDSSVSATGTVSEVGIYRYYYRLNAVDVNGNIVASATTGYQDHVVQLTSDAAINHKLIGFPAFELYDYDRLELQIYRTHLNLQAPFYLVTTLTIPFDRNDNYISYTDTFADTDLTQLDVVNTALRGSELGISWSDPLRASYTTSISNSLVLGGVTDYPQWDIQVVAPANTTSSSFAGDSLLFRKDSADAGTSTNMVDRVRYEWRSSTSGNATAYSVGSDEFTVTCDSLPVATTVGDWVYLTYSNTEQRRTATFVDADVNTGTETITISNHGFTLNQQVRFSNSGGALPGGLSSSTTYYILAPTTNTFQLATSPGGSAHNIATAAGGGTHTIVLQANDLQFSGWWQITGVSSTDVTVACVGAATATTYPDKYVVATDPTDVPVLLGTDGSLGMANGDSFDLFDATRRLSLAINATMRAVNTSITGMGSYTPWMIARSGNDTPPAGRIVIRSPLVLDTTPELVPTFSGYQLFVNQIRRTTGDSISASTRIFPSRLLVSYENYPEIFDNPTTLLDSESDSAIDVNPADGQELTGAIPFFGDSAFGSSQQSSILAVFKTNSIYLVDLNEKRAGRNAVQKIESRGLGCTAPYSITVTKDGISFANESGVYCLRRNLTIQYIGKYNERNWRGVSRSRLSIAQGTHYSIESVYKLSVPISGTEDGNYIENSQVFVYNHTNEEEGRLGSWSRYSNHPVTGWCNLAGEAYFGSTGGRVYSIRNTGTITDYRDDSSSIDFQLSPRSNDFGNSAIRKLVDRIVIHYRSENPSEGTSVSYATDNGTSYTSTDAVRILRTSDGVTRDIVSVEHSIADRKCLFLALRIRNNTIDESVEVAGIDYRVGGLAATGLVSARDT
jgi:hypothetical protein